MTYENKVRAIVKKYEQPEVVSIVRNIQGTYDIELDENFYWKEQMKMEKELVALGLTNDIYYRSVV